MRIPVHCLLSCVLLHAALAAQEPDLQAPVDVPDEFGLGERLALIAWLKERNVRIGDADDLPGLRAAYLLRIRPATAAAGIDPARDELAVQLWRRHNVNADAKASVAELRQQLAQLDDRLRRTEEDNQRDLDRLVADSRRRQAAAAPPAEAPSRPGTAAGAPVAVLPRPVEEGWHKHGGETATTYRLHRDALRAAFVIQNPVGKPWTAEAIAYLDDSAADLAGGMVAAALAGELPARGSRLIAAGCDDPMVLYRHAVVDSYLRYRKNLVRAYEAMRGSAYPAIYRMACAERMVAELWSSRDHGPDDDATTAAAEVWLQAVRQVLLSRPAEPALRQLHARLLGDFDHQPHEWRRLEVVEAEALGGLMDPWLAHTLLGQVCIAKAWKARGGGWAKDVTQEGWKDFAQHLESARGHFEAAWELDPRLPMPADQMITVAMGLGAGRGELDRWFERAITASPEDLQAWANRMHAAQSRWGGSQADLLAIARRALACGFETDAPYAYLRALEMAQAESQPGGPELPLIRRPDVWQEVTQVFDGMLATPAWTRQRRLLTLRYAGLAYDSGRFASCRRIIEQADLAITGFPWVHDQAQAQHDLYERAATGQHVVRRHGHHFYVVADAPDESWLPQAFRSQERAEQEAARLNAADPAQP